MTQIDIPGKHPEKHHMFLLTTSIQNSKIPAWLRLFVLATFTVLSAPAIAQVVIGGWDTSTLPGGSNNFGPSPYAATETAANVTVGGLTRGAGISTSGTGAARGWGGTSWGSSFNSGDSSVLFNKFFTFTVKANAGYTLSLSSISPFDYRRSATGPLFAEIQYQINGGPYSLITTVSLPSTSTSGGSVGSTDLSGISALQNLPSSSTVTFRIVPYRATSTTGTFYIFDTGASTGNDFAVNGTLCAPPSCNVSGPDYVCSNTENNVYTAPGGMSAYSWSVSANGSIPGSTTGSSVSVTSGNFVTDYTVSVTVTDANGCTSSCSKQSFTYLQKPPADITANPNPVCFGATLDLSISAAASSTVSWTGEGINNSSGNPSTTANPTTTGPHVYSVMVTANPSGCSNTGSVNVMVNPLPTATCPSDISVCDDAAPFALTGATPTGGTYSGAGVTANNFNAASAGLGPHVITYTYTDGNGCSDDCTFTVTVTPLPTVFNMTGGGSYCSGGPGVEVGLSGSEVGVQYDLYRDGNYVSTLFGTGNPLSFGLQTMAGTYQIVAQKDLCQRLMSGVAIVTVQSCGSIEFSGKIVWEADDVSGVKNATVNLTGSATGNDLTDVNGDFMITTGLTSGSFTLKPVKNINKYNGVTSGDATAIQQHVTLINPITDPYKLVCADVNKNNVVNTLDASIITQALLGNPAANAQFKTSWRFVPSDYALSVPPWGFPEQRTYTGISGPQTNQDFIGMKTGDVTGDANPANFGSGQPMVLRAIDRVLQSGEAVDVAVSADQLDDLAAFQFGLRFNPAQLQFESVEPAGGSFPLTADNFGLYNVAEGEIRAVWSQAKGLRVEESAPVFHLRFTAGQSGAKLSEALKLDDAVLPGLAYTSKLAESTVELTFSEATGTNDPAASILNMQVRPNPLRDATTVSFHLPEGCDAQLRVLDVNGRELLRINNTYPAGNNSEMLQLNGLADSGILYCELVTPFGVVTRKMVVAQ